MLASTIAESSFGRTTASSRPVQCANAPGNPVFQLACCHPALSPPCPRCGYSCRPRHYQSACAPTDRLGTSLHRPSLTQHAVRLKAAEGRSHDVALVWSSGCRPLACPSSCIQNLVGTTACHFEGRGTPQPAAPRVSSSPFLTMRAILAHGWSWSTSLRPAKNQAKASQLPSHGSRRIAWPCSIAYRARNPASLRLTFKSPLR